MRRILSLLALLALAPSARAATVSGSLTPAYGAPIVVQTTQTTNDATSGTAVNGSPGSELDGAYAYAANDTLYLFLSGNMQLALQLQGLITHVQPVYVFIDCKAGGQNVLQPSNPYVDSAFDLAGLAELTFDPGFEPDYCFALGCQSDPTLRAYEAELPSGGGGPGTFLGQTAPGATGTLSGGTNPYAIAATLNDANAAGVSQGCGASSGAGVPTGIEWAIPMAAIGNPIGCIRVSAFVREWNQATLLNQVLGPLPPGTCNLGPASGVDFGAIAGNQYYSVCTGATPARTTTWGSLKSRYH
jgi:hypothetical protein